MVSQVANHCPIVNVCDLTKSTKLSAIRGRIICVWEIPYYKNPGVTYSMELIVMDEQIYSYDIVILYT